MALSYMDTAKELKEDLNVLVSSIDSTKASIAKLLEGARRFEGALIDREEKLKAEKLEQERKERLASLLASDSQSVAHVGGEDEPEGEQETAREQVTEVQPVSEAQTASKETSAEFSARPIRDQRRDNPRQERTRQQGQDARTNAGSDRVRRQDTRTGTSERTSSDRNQPSRQQSGNRAVVINTPSPSDRNRNDKKKNYDTPDKKAKNKK
ncbi:MAG: hypothetical protein J6Y95_06510, partial [Lachnospiraceae bacterium]|nr:hypothetical protein [Lachnospiraceae bacterium]